MSSPLPIQAFKDRAELRRWLERNASTSAGLRVRLYKKGSQTSSISFHDLLEEGLCFGWSESKRQAYDESSYLQFFTPRKTKGTTSTRNRELAERLIREGKMTESGSKALDWK